MAKKKLTQVQLVMRHLINRGSITQEQALRLYGIGRLAARIGDINNMRWGMRFIGDYCGWIEAQPVKHKTRQGRAGTHAKYVFNPGSMDKKWHRERWGL